MRNLTPLLVAAALATTGVASAQLRLDTLTGGTNQGNVGGGIYFDLQVNTTVTFTQIEFRCGATTVAGTGTMDVWLGPSTYQNNVTNAALWTLVGSTNPTAVAPSAVSVGTLATPFALGPGTYGIALKANNFSHGYTNGVTCTSTTIPGSCANSLFSNTQLVLRAGAAQNSFLTGGVFTPRIFNGALVYNLGGTPIQVAAWEDYGRGCNEFYRSYYQLFPNPVALNLGTTGGVTNPITSIRHVFQGNRYDVVPGTAAVVNPTSPPITLASGNQAFLASTALGAPLPFGIPYPLNGSLASANDLEICTEGYVVPSPATQAVQTAPTPASFLSGAPRWAVHWKSMNPIAVGSSMHIEQDNTSGALLVTWLAVADQGFATTSTFQIAFFPFGDVEYRYGVMSQNGGGGQPVIIGWTNGGGALDPGTVELATALPFATESTDNPPLTLGLNNRPVLGTAIELVTDNIPAGTAFGAIALGFVQNNPGINLGFIGMPDCFAHHSSDIVVGVPFPTAQNRFPLTIPNTPALNGASLFGQSLSVSPGANPNGVLTSNGARLRLGSL